MAKILVVDDSVSMRRMVSFTLKGAGYDVTDAIDGIDALDKASANTFDLVISDLHMPNMDGIALIKELRTMPDFKTTPMLMVTTASSEEQKQQGRDVGATGWIVKPFNTEQLLSTIKKVLA